MGASVLGGRINGSSPDSQLLAALGVGTDLQLPSSRIQLCGVYCRGGSVKVVEKGLEFQSSTELQSMQSLQQQVTKRKDEKKTLEEKQKGLAAKIKAEGDAFLSKNKERKEVGTTASGLQYEVLREGTGPTPKATDKVTVHYKGALIDGTVFDSSYDRGEPATFVLNQTLPGWAEGLQLMKVGSKYKFYIPAALAYGERGNQGVIGPNAPLVFEVDLLSIESEQ